MGMQRAEILVADRDDLVAYEGNIASIPDGPHVQASAWLHRVLDEVDGVVEVGETQCMFPAEPEAA